MMRSPSIGLGDQQRAQPLRRNQQGLDIAFGVTVDQRDPPGQLTDLGEELARPLVDDGADMAEAIALRDRDMAGEDDEHARPGLAGFEQTLAVLVGSRFTEPPDPLDLLRRQRRECLLVPRKQGRIRTGAGRTGAE